MKLIQNQPAASWTQAFPVGNREMVCRVYGRTGEERIDLAEKRFLALRDGKVSRGKSIVGHLLIQNFGEEQTDEYRRELDLQAGTALARWRSGGSLTESAAFVPGAYKIMVYEITRPTNDLNVRLTYVPENQEDYINYNIGGLFFTSSISGHILCGKAALYTNGFPRADQEGIFVKNASRVALYIMLDMGEDRGEGANGMLDLQMAMNRTLVNMESHSLNELRKGPMGNMAAYRKMAKRLAKGLPSKWKDGFVE